MFIGILIPIGIQDGMFWTRVVSKKIKIDLRDATHDNKNKIPKLMIFAIFCVNSTRKERTENKNIID